MLKISISLFEEEHILHIVGFVFKTHYTVTISDNF